MTELTDADLHELGQEARRQHDSIAGQCRAIAMTMQQLADDRYGVQLDVRELRIGDRRDTHYVNVLAPTAYAGDADGRVLVDAALDQFCTENQHRDDIRVDLGPRKYIDEVGVYLEGDEERIHWYHRPNELDETADPLE